MDRVTRSRWKTGGPALPLAAVLLLAAAASGGEAVFSLHGKARKAVILFGDRASANALADALGRTTGTRPSVVRAGSPASPDELQVHVGQDERVKSLGLDLATLHPCGYCIRLADDGTLVLAGRTPLGTRYAVYDFLKRFAGYRWLGPGELGEVLPKKDGIELPDRLDLREQPSFITFMFGGHAFLRGCHVNVQATHNLSNIYPPARYAEAHPEYYPMIGGKRVVPPKGSQGTWQPCTSNPELVPIAADYARQFFAKHPEALGLSLGVNDGGGDCQCEACARRRQLYRNQYIPFVNDVAKAIAEAFPGKLVGFLTYGGAGPVPQGITLEPSIYVEIMHGGFRNDFEGIKQWRRAGAKHTGMYGWLWGSAAAGYVVPRHYPHLLGNAWKKAHKEFGLEGMWFDPGSGGTWLYEGARNYVLCELGWNINADIDALLDDYYAAAYAEAAQDVRRFFDRIEAIHARKPDPLDFCGDSTWGGAPLEQFAHYTSDDLAYLDAQLEAAGRAAKEPKAAERLAILARLWGLSRLHVAAYLEADKVQKTAGITSEAQIARLVDAAARGLKLLGEIESHAFDDGQLKALFPAAKDPRARLCDGFQDCHRLRVLIENAVERVCDLGSAFLEKQPGGAASARAFWVKTAEGVEDAMLRAVLLTQVYEREAPDAGRSLIPPAAAGFEPESEPPDAPAQVEWNKRLGLGWGTYSDFPVTRHFLDRTEAHSGRHSAAVLECTIRGGFISSYPVAPGCRYRFSVWVKQQPPDKGGDLVIRWSKQGGGWADQGPGAPASILHVPYPRAAQSAWRKVECTFTAPAGVARCIPLLGAPRGLKMGEGGVWFDDASLVKLYDPSYFEPVPATAKPH